MKNKATQSGISANEGPGNSGLGSSVAAATANNGVLRFSLTGPSQKIDPAITAIRGDLADIAFAGKVFVPHYAVPVGYHAVADDVAVFQADDESSPVVGNLKRGEAFAVLDISGGWAWGYAVADHRVGHVSIVQIAVDELA